MSRPAPRDAWDNGSFGRCTSCGKIRYRTVLLLQRSPSAGTTWSVLGLLFGYPLVMMYGMTQDTGATRIAAERQRQIDQKGYTPNHDHHHDGGALMNAASIYIAYVEWHGLYPDRPLTATQFLDTRDPHGVWPWAEEDFKPCCTTHSLIKAGALIAAEIDRIAAGETTETGPVCSQCSAPWRPVQRGQCSACGSDAGPGERDQWDGKEPCPRCGHSWSSHGRHGCAFSGSSASCRCGAANYA